VPELGLGCVKIGRDKHLGYASPAQICDDLTAARLLKLALELGVTLIDTSPAYGSSERRLGELLPRVAPRERWTICSKAGELFDPDAGSRYDFTKKAIVASVERSLRDLGTDHLDILLLHFNSSTDLDAQTLARAETWDTLDALKHQGKARAVGASVGTRAGAELALGLRAGDPHSAAPALDVLMLTLNHAERQMLPIVELARARGVGVLIKKPLASGHGLQAIPPDEALRAVVDTPGVSAAIVGTTSPDHLRANAKALSAR
jgi:aryl-alcohol dehydrogenase-like predicted oxidoreductase